MVTNQHQYNNMEEVNISREYINKKNNSDIINFPVLFRGEALLIKKNNELIQAPVSAMRILFKVLHDISHDQFQAEKQTEQLNLFEKDFQTKNNSFCRFSFPIEDIDKNRVYTNVEKGLEFLEELNKGWYQAKNSKGETVKTYGGVISIPNIKDGQVQFLISGYWIEKLLKIPQYNEVIYQLAWELPKAKQILFYLWLLEIPKTGTRVKFETFQDNYNFNYKKASVFSKNFLKKIKNILDQYSNLSFNYAVDGEYINIVPYPTKKINLALREKTVKKQEITQKLHYWKTRHKLNENQFDTLKSVINIDTSAFPLFKNSYKLLVETLRKEKVKVTTYKGDDFMKLFQDHIKTYYQNSAYTTLMKGGHPNIMD